MDTEPKSYQYKKVMVIDDMEVDIYIAKHAISKSNFAEEVVCQSSAQAALDFLNQCLQNKEGLPQLIFLDIRMPDMDGFGFLKEYEKLADEIKRACTLIMLSSSLNLEDHLRAENSPHVLKFLNKPLSQVQLTKIAAEIKVNQ